MLATVLLGVNWISISYFYDRNLSSTMLVQLGLSPWEEAGSAPLTKSVIQQLSLLSLRVSTSSFELRCRGFGAEVSQGLGLGWGGRQLRGSPLHWHTPADGSWRSPLRARARYQVEGRGAPPLSCGNFREAVCGVICLIAYMSLNLECGLLFWRDPIALWCSPGTHKLSQGRLPGLCCDAGGNIDHSTVKWMSGLLGVFLFWFFFLNSKEENIPSNAGCSQRQQERDTDALTFSIGAWDEESLTPARRGDPRPRGAAHHEQGSADRQDAAGEPERLRLSAHPGAAQPRRWGELAGREAGRSLHCGRGCGSVLFNSRCCPKRLVPVCWPKGY